MAGRAELERYSESIKAAGYDELEFVLSADEADLKEMAADIGMKKPHAKMLLRGWNQLVETERQ